VRNAAIQQKIQAADSARYESLLRQQQRRWARASDCRQQQQAAGAAGRDAGTLQTGWQTGVQGRLCCLSQAASKQQAKAEALDDIGL